MRNFRTRLNTAGCDSKPSSDLKKERCGGKQPMRRIRLASKTTLRMPFSIAYTSKRSVVGGLLPIQWNRRWDSLARSVPRARNDPIGPFQIEIARGERNLSTVIGVTPRSYSPFKQAHLARAPSVNTIIAVRSAKSGSLGRDVIPLTACCDSYHSSAYQKRVNISLEL